MFEVGEEVICIHLNKRATCTYEHDLPFVIGGIYKISNVLLDNKGDVNFQFENVPNPCDINKYSKKYNHISWWGGRFRKVQKNDLSIERFMSTHNNIPKEDERDIPCRRKVEVKQPEKEIA